MKNDLITRKQSIINAAADLFKERGYSATSIRDLAASVGLEPSSIYSHIRSKEELLIEICLSCAERFTDGMNDIYNQELPVKKKIKSLIQLHLNIAYDIPASVTVFNDEWKFLPEPAKNDFLNARKEYEKKFKKILNEGKKQGKFKFENEDIVFNIIIKMLSWSYAAIKKHDQSELEEELTGFIIRSLIK
jgi:AcrR family transcriptional regulator